MIFIQKLSVMDISFLQKHRYITILLFSLGNTLYAQDASHLNIWSRMSFIQPISALWRAEVEFQHRRQSDYAENSGHLFQANLLSSVRTWVQYQHKDGISFSLSPFAYYWHTPIIVTNADKLKSQVQELRFSLAVDLKHEITDNLWLVDRTCVEYRDFQSVGTDIIRMRNRLGLRYDMHSAWSVTLFEEIFLNIRGAALSHIFDHDRMALLLNYKPVENLRIEVGYLYISRLQRERNELLHENNFLLHFYYTLPVLTNYRTQQQHHS